MSSPTGIEFKALYPIILLSVFMFIVCMLIFGIAVHRGMNRLFAPRSWARPKAVSVELYDATGNILCVHETNAATRKHLIFDIFPPND